jgi:hypothetical protein
MLSHPLVGISSGQVVDEYRIYKKGLVRHLPTLTPQRIMPETCGSPSFEHNRISSHSKTPPFSVSHAFLYK